jgi:hypothetical protein
MFFSKEKKQSRERKKKQFWAWKGVLQHRGERGRKRDKKKIIFFFWTVSSVVNKLLNSTYSARVVPYGIPEK